MINFVLRGELELISHVHTSGSTGAITIKNVSGDRHSYSSNSNSDAFRFSDGEFEVFAELPNDVRLRVPVTGGAVNTSLQNGGEITLNYDLTGVQKDGIVVPRFQHAENLTVVYRGMIGDENAVTGLFIQRPGTFNVNIPNGQIKDLLTTGVISCLVMETGVVSEQLCRKANTFN